VEEVLLVSRRPYNREQSRLKQVIVKDFFHLESAAAALQGYNACFFCAGVSSIGKNEADYTHLTYDTTLAFAKQLLQYSPDLTFIYVSGAGTNIGSRQMWARVKGRTEADLAALPFRKEYNFRPAFMKAFPGQENLNSWYYAVAWLYPLVKLIYPAGVSTLKQVGTAMINSVLAGYPKNVLEVKDINELGRQ
jgi:uncharacterized protein YbjT (DUF2867 family)